MEGQAGGWGKKFESFLSNNLSQPLNIWHAALTCGSILEDSISGLLLIHFLFTELVKFST
jgi:hypothetical protein